MKWLSLSSQEKNKLLASMNELKRKNVDLSSNFYEIFLTNEEIATLFKFVPIETQKKMFKVSLESIIYFMDNPSQMKLELLDMGKKHKSYGVKKYHVPIFKESLLGALKKSYGNNLDNELLQVWGKAIDIIVDSLSKNLI